jgi:hypothetical protein
MDGSGPNRECGNRILVDEGNMNRGVKIAALLAVLGMAAMSLGAAVVLSRSCCSADCEKCPMSFCKDSNADLAKKIVTPVIAGTPVTAAIRFSFRSLELAADRIFEAPCSGFVRPMRN